MTKKGIRATFLFDSSTVPNKRYTALLYEDGSTSCNCPGWTRRVAEDGSRECKHTRAIKDTNRQARSRTEPYSGWQGSVSVSVPANTPVTVRATKGTKVMVSSSNEDSRRVRRRFSFDD